MGIIIIHHVYNLQQSYNLIKECEYTGRLTERSARICNVVKYKTSFYNIRHNYTTF